MAVNLKATATLNAKPFIASLKSLSAETAKLNKSAIAGSTAVKSGVLGEVAARESASRAVRASTQAVTNATSVNSKAIASARDYLKVQEESVRVADRISNAYRTMSLAEARNEEAKLRYAQSRLALLRAMDAGIEGPALSPYVDRVSAAEVAQAKARASLARATDGQAEATKRLSTAQQETTDAQQRGASAANGYTKSLAGMSQETLRQQAAAERLSAAHGRLAASLVASGGAITPAVSAARAGVLSAEASYRKLAAAQQEVADTGHAAATGLSSQRYLYHDLARQAATAALVMAAPAAIAVTTAAVWEDAFADVRRTADPTFRDVQSKSDALRSSLVSMAQSMPSSFGDITEIATLANQMGIAATQTAEFTRATAMFAATSGVSVDMAATAFGRLTSIMGDKAIGFIDMADSILKVGVNSVATESEIINVTTQISSIAAQAGFGTKEIIGLSGALASVRVPPELSRGLITRVFGQIDKAVSNGGASLENLARISGTTASEFGKQWGKEGSATLFNNFMRGLRDLGPAARSEIEALGITSVRDVPVILRLANAADSDGNVGELLTQTLRDANNAAGETQKQYSIMAETVWGKLRILGNNVLAFFDAIGRQGLGPLGDVLENASDGIRTLTRSLDDGAPILGEFGVTVGDVIGTLTLLSAAGAGLLLIGSGVLKAKAATVGLKQLVAVTPGLSSLVGTLGGGVPVVTNFGTASGKAATSTGKFGTALRGLGGVGGVAALAGLAIGIGMLVALNNEMQKNVTTAEEMSTKLSQLSTHDISSVSKMMEDITVAGPGDFFGAEFWSGKINTKPFNEGITDYRNAINELSALNQENLVESFGNKTIAGLSNWMDITGKGMWDEVDGIKNFDGALQEMVDAGNGTKALGLLKNLYTSGDQLRFLMDSGFAPGSSDLLSNAFDLAGIEMTDAALDNFVNGRLPEVLDAMTGIKNSGAMLDDVFDGSEEALGEFINIVDQASASFIDLSAAMEKGTKVDADGNFMSFDLGAFTEALNVSVKDQSKWATDMEVIAKNGSLALVQELAQLGPAAKDQVGALAQSLRDGAPEGVAALEALEQALSAKVTGLGSTLGAALSSAAWFKKMSGDADLGKLLAGMFTIEQTDALREAAEGVSQDYVQGILDSLAREEITIDEAISSLLSKQPPEAVVKLSVDDGSAINGMKAAVAKLSKDRGVIIPVSVDGTTSIGVLKAELNDPELSEIDIDANLSLTEAYAASTEFQMWAKANGIDIFLGADSTSAMFTLETLLAFASGQVATVGIDALPAPAEGNLWKFITMANGETAFVQVDADGNLAEGEIQYIVNKAGEARPEIVFSANDWAARNTAAYWNGRTVGTAFVNIVGRGSVNASTALNHANGAVTEYYAKGGVRENHTAQIAPAGSMRVWAEPETGGEAYIPLTKTKRKRSEAILADVANRFGMQLSSNNDTTRYADGGFYNQQQMSRAYRQAIPAQQYGSPVDSKRDISFTFVNPVVRDPYQDAWDKAQELGVTF